MVWSNCASFLLPLELVTGSPLWRPSTWIFPFSSSLFRASQLICLKSFPIEAAQERISSDGGITVLLDLLTTTNDFSLNLGATAVLWNLSVNGTHISPMRSRGHS